jgi:hypothetical protein
VAIALVLGGGVAAALWFGGTGKPSGGALEGKLNVFVRPPEHGAQSKPVEEPGALPARSGGLMSLQAQLEQPAFVYFVWLDSEGQALPLYPWNTTTLEVKDIHLAPPVRIAAKLVDSPLLGGGWMFGKKGGMETVLLLARRTALPEGIKLAALLDPLPPPVNAGEPEELLILEMDPGAKVVTATKERGRRSGEAKAADEELTKLLLRLGEHFDLVRAVRFANVGEESGETNALNNPN